MTVPAVDAVVGDVVHVAELQRLLDEDVLPGDVSRPGDDDRQEDEAHHKGKKPENADLGECVGAAMEYLRHLTLAGPTRRLKSSQTDCCGG
jgi:hypothetical protein